MVPFAGATRTGTPTLPIIVFSCSVQITAYVPAATNRYEKVASLISPES